MTPVQKAVQKLLDKELVIKESNRKSGVVSLQEAIDILEELEIDILNEKIEEKGRPIQNNLE